MIAELVDIVDTGGQELGKFQRLARADGHAFVRLFGHPAGDACIGLDKLGEARRALHRRPVSTMPCSMTSPASSGGVVSSTRCTPESISISGSDRASPISRASTGRTAGRPVRASRPLASITEAVSGDMADPMDFLMLSAMRVPMIRLYLVRR